MVWPIYEGPCKKSGTSVALTTSDDTGAIVYLHAGALSDWTLAALTLRGPYFWHRQQPDLSVRQGRTYEIKFLVKKVDTKSPPMKAQVRLEGGGRCLTEAADGTHVKRLYDYLSSRIGNLPPGVPETDLLAFESRHLVQLPSDLRSCFLLFDGTNDQWADDWLIAFWPLERVERVTDQDFPEAG